MDSKFVPVKDANNMICPLEVNRMHSCEGDLCMFWKWTGFTVRCETLVQQSECDKLYRPEDVKTKENTHGCCGQAYSHEIELKEMK